MMTAEPLQFLLMRMAGWVNRRQLDVIDYPKEENRVLRESLGGRRLRFTDDQRRRLLAKGHALGRRMLDELAVLVTLDAEQRREQREKAVHGNGASPTTELGSHTVTYRDAQGTS